MCQCTCYGAYPCKKGLPSRRHDRSVMNMSQRRLPTIALLTLLVGSFSVVTPASAGQNCPGSTDLMDTDRDRLSDCLETELLGSVPASADTDVDGIGDVWDLIKQSDDAVDIPIQVKIVEARDSTSHGCDVQHSGSWTWWDPYFGTAALLNPTIEGTQRKVGFTNVWTEGNHPEDRRTIEIDDMVAQIEIPQNFNIMQPVAGDWPGLVLKIGMLDDDYWTSFDDHVALDLGGDLNAYLPITKGPGGEEIERTYDDGNDKCNGAILVTVHSPVNAADFIAATIAKGTGGLVTWDSVTSQLVSYNRAMRSAASVGHGSVDAVGYETGEIVAGGPGDIASAGRDAQEAPDVDDRDHPVQQSMENSVYGPVVRSGRAQILQAGESTECLYSTWKDGSDCDGKDPLGTGGPPPIVVTPEGLQEFLSRCGVAATSSGQRMTDSQCDVVLALLMGLAGQAVGAAQETLEQCGASATTRAESNTCQAVLQEVQGLPATVVSTLSELLASCGLQTDTRSADTECDALLEEVGKLPATILKIVEDALQEIPDCQIEAQSRANCPRIPEIPRCGDGNEEGEIECPDLDDIEIPQCGRGLDCPEIDDVQVPRCGDGNADGEIRCPNLGDIELPQLGDFELNCGDERAASDLKCPTLPTLDFASLAPLQEAIGNFLVDFCMGCVVNTVQTCPAISGQVAAPASDVTQLTMPAGDDGYHYLHVEALDAAGQVVDEGTLRLATGNTAAFQYATWTLPTLRTCETDVESVRVELQRVADGTVQVIQQAESAFHVDASQRSLILSNSQMFMVVLDDAGAPVWAFEDGAASLWDILMDYVVV